ncbi:hypothetical protein IW261DRAFT_1465383 [Armillaria novae-zelandiae]|uniref:Uncharacterized protein n=1 Tax=Armillaria novae-zelandiae TaxID=153914 RepID=A0AA39TEF4_9AGAR|nr:hypothetical protein IW261DRAFT_1465383 [Armillaria novae-zelandiae]
MMKSRLPLSMAFLRDVTRVLGRFQRDARLVFVFPWKTMMTRGLPASLRVDPRLWISHFHNLPFSSHPAPFMYLHSHLCLPHLNIYLSLLPPHPTLPPPSLSLPSCDVQPQKKSSLLSTSPASHPLSTKEKSSSCSSRPMRRNPGNILGPLLIEESRIPVLKKRRRARLESGPEILQEPGKTVVGARLSGRKGRVRGTVVAPTKHRGIVMGPDVWNGESWRISRTRFCIL